GLSGRPPKARLLINVLEESVEVTVPGILCSARKLIDAAGGLLLSVWTQRRANPALLLQPREQWPSGAAGQPATQFSGYSPMSAPFTPRALVSDGIVERRMRAAAIMDDQRAQWGNFD
ncbi:MAG: hypothetical protein ACRD1L_14005, partial [Terriglobales bacterium]